MNEVLTHWHVLLAGIEFENWAYKIGMDDKRPFLQISFTDIDTVTNEVAFWTCRKWFLSYHMTDSEVVQTAFLATMTAMEHEVREKFTWEGEPIFRPHFDIKELHKISRDGKTSKRE